MGMRPNYEGIDAAIIAAGIQWPNNAAGLQRFQVRGKVYFEPRLGHPEDPPNGTTLVEVGLRENPPPTPDEIADLPAIQAIIAAGDWRPKRPRTRAAIMTDLAALKPQDKAKLTGPAAAWQHGTEDRTCWPLTGDDTIVAWLQANPRAAVALGVQVSGEEPDI